MFPVEPERGGGHRRRRARVRAGGAQVEEVELGIERDQRELCDLWARLIMPVNVARSSPS